MLKRTRALASVAVIAVITGMGAPAWAETLKDALALAFNAWLWWYSGQQLGDAEGNRRGLKLMACRAG